MIKLWGRLASRPYDSCTGQDEAEGEHTKLFAGGNQPVATTIPAHLLEKFYIATMPVAVGV